MCERCRRCRGNARNQCKSLGPAGGRPGVRGGAGGCVPCTGVVTVTAPPAVHHLQSSASHRAGHSLPAPPATTLLWQSHTTFHARAEVYLESGRKIFVIIGSADCCHGDGGSCEDDDTIKKRVPVMLVIQSSCRPSLTRPSEAA